MLRTEIKHIYENAGEFAERAVTVCGWVKSIRVSKGLAFVSISDGSCFLPAQIVAQEDKCADFSSLIKVTTGAAVMVKGTVIHTPDAKQPFEISASEVIIEGNAAADYPLQKKAHSLEFLRTIPHLRARTNTFQAVFKIRSAASFAIHRYFNDNGFVYAHTPIITGSDCEGAGEMFKVTTLESAAPKNKDGGIDYTNDFFGVPASLTVSGQLEGEYMALAFGKIYTFGPTFRAEKSYTARHAAEFWMVEPEIAFADLSDDMALAESLLKFVIGELLRECSHELKFCNDFYEKGLLERLNSLLSSDFARCTYTEAIRLLGESGESFEYPVEWGLDLQTEHERFLTEKIFRRPVFVTDYPKDIKAFYMRQNDDGKTVAAMDLLVPGVGELIGGSQREERHDYLVKRIEEMGLPVSEYSRYLDSRRFGGVSHAGFGLGFERLIMYATGIANIRDVIPFPRVAGGIY
ncbi:MAG: asparagine--tRNA ligase [Oscillospiraceae bacterium]|nr:asparagine--tRNA ligase [Oscillospiraceae bacterium]